MTTIRLVRPFSATHQILILGELEPVHGHDFSAAIEVAVEDGRDARMLEPVLQQALDRLERTHLEEVERGEGGSASAERIAAWLFRAVARGLDAGARIERATIGESPGCWASYRDR